MNADAPAVNREGQESIPPTPPQVQLASAKQAGDWRSWRGPCINGLVMALLVVLIGGNLVAVRVITRLEGHWREVRETRAQQLAQEKDYESASQTMVAVGHKRLQEQTEILSMMEQLRELPEFGIIRGTKLFFRHRFRDHRQLEPTLVFYLPAGQHRLEGAQRECANQREILEFILSEFPEEPQAEPWELSGDAMYELRYDRILPDEPRGAGVSLRRWDLGSAPEEEREVGRREFASSLPVVGVAGGWGDAIRWGPLGESVYRAASPPPVGTRAESGAAAARLPRGWTELAGASFRLGTSSVEHPVGAAGPTLVLRWRLGSAPSPATVVAWEELYEHIRQPHVPSLEVVNYLFTRGAWRELEQLARLRAGKRR